MSILDALYSQADLQCTKCGKKSSVGCSCWKKCTVPGCKWSYENIKGVKCGNPEHPHNKGKKPVFKSIATGKLKL